jgi:putative flippase GtrA
VILSDLAGHLPAPIADLLRKPGARQLIRYVIAGFCVTQFAAFIYSFLAVYAHVIPLEANVVSTGAGLCAGFVAHNHWSFAEGAAGSECAKAARFGFATLLAFFFNSFWVFILVTRMHFSPLAPVPIMMFVTPWVSFLANRYWVFKAA